MSPAAPLTFTTREAALKAEAEHIDGHVPSWTYYVYVVAAPERDGTAPSFEKALNDTVYTEYDKAVAARNDARMATGYDGYAIFEAAIIIPRKAPAIVDSPYAFDARYFRQG